MDAMVIRSFSKDIEDLTRETAKLTKCLKKQNVKIFGLAVIAAVLGAEVYLLNKEINDLKEGDMTYDDFKTDTED